VDARPAAPAAVRRFVDGWYRVECALAVAAFGFIAAVLILDVAGRELLAPLFAGLGIEAGPTGVYGAQKMAVFALVIASYSGIGIAAATAGHIVPRVGHAAVPAAWGAGLDRLADLVSGLFLLGAAWYGLELVRGSYASGLRAAMLQWPVWPVQLAIPLGFASAALRYLCSACWPGLRPLPPAAQE
jgi:TRAP-type C4-dicarboxylate transport system permease small subunit